MTRYIAANDKLYTYSDHMILQENIHGVKADWIEAVMNAPERYELSVSSGYMLYIGSIEGREEPFFVVVHEEHEQIVTAYFGERL